MGRCEEVKGMTLEALPSFWRAVFEVTGMLAEEEDSECMNLLDGFVCESLDGQIGNTRIKFTFQEETKLFSNKTLEIEVRG